MVGRYHAVSAALLAALGGAFGCSDTGTSDQKSVTTASGTCDQSANRMQCLEITSDEDSVADERDFCTSSSGAWSSAPCPTGPDLVGCCLYQADGQFRECFYTGAVEPTVYCEMSVHGEWRPGSR